MKPGWIQTFTGKKFFPLCPEIPRIDIVDIAHALSMICRYNGHCKKFYSVAEHSCHIYDRVSPRNRIAALLHDATKAYISDIVRPVKPHLVGYSKIENRLHRSICKRFDIDIEIPEEVQKADYLILTDECDQAMSSPPEVWSTRSEGLGVTLKFWNPEVAKEEFLNRWYSARIVSRHSF